MEPDPNVTALAKQAAYHLGEAVTYAEYISKKGEVDRWAVRAVEKSIHRAQGYLWSAQTIQNLKPSGE